MFSAASRSTVRIGSPSMLSTIEAMSSGLAYTTPSTSTFRTDNSGLVNNNRTMMTAATANPRTENQRSRRRPSSRRTAIRRNRKREAPLSEGFREDFLSTTSESSEITTRFLPELSTFVCGTFFAVTNASESSKLFGRSFSRRSLKNENLSLMPSPALTRLTELLNEGRTRTPAAQLS